MEREWKKDPAAEGNRNVAGKGAGSIFHKKRPCGGVEIMTLEEQYRVGRGGTL